MTEQVVKFDAYSCTKSLKVSEHQIHKSWQLLALVLPKNYRTTETYEHHTALSSAVM